MTIDNYFDQFGLPECFLIDTEALDAAFRVTQAAIHPDYFATADDAQKQQATRQSALVSQAWRTLKDPLKRAIYLLHLRGINVAAEENTAMPPDFLMDQLAWREALEAAATSKDQSTLHTLLEILREQQQERFAALANLLDAPPDPDIQAESAVRSTQAVRELMFIDRLVQTAELQLDELCQDQDE